EPASVMASAPAIEAPAPALPIDDESDVVPIESLLLADETDVVPIESLAPTKVDVPPAAEPVHSPQGWDLVDSYLTFEALLAGKAETPSSLASPETTRLAPSQPSGQAAEPRRTQPGVQLAEHPEGDIVDIDTLLYRGRSALRRADELRKEIRATAIHSERAVDLKPMVDELLDLVELALTE
ncbi:MAG TPA: hypothetical protein VG817_04900, partial [Gemmatimonadales bacterium]|nr:hypothetical protein [Gemmatimonadales bacterium]